MIRTNFASHHTGGLHATTIGLVVACTATITQADKSGCVRVLGKPDDRRKKRR